MSRVKEQRIVLPNKRLVSITVDMLLGQVKELWVSADGQRQWGRRWPIHGPTWACMDLASVAVILQSHTFIETWNPRDPQDSTQRVNMSIVHTQTQTGINQVEMSTYRRHRGAARVFGLCRPTAALQTWIKYQPATRSNILKSMNTMPTHHVVMPLSH